MSEFIGIMVAICAFWHVVSFAFGLVYIHFSLKSLVGIIPYDQSWKIVIRSSDLHLWLSGIGLILLGTLENDIDVYIDNPKLLCKVTVIMVWFFSTQAIRHYAVPKLQRDNPKPMLYLSSINLACWIYGAILGCAKPLAGIVPYSAFLAGFFVVITLCFLALMPLKAKAKRQCLRRKSTSNINSI